MARAAYHVTLIDALDRIALRARLDEKPPPTLEVDFSSAFQFAEMIAQSIGCVVHDLQPRDLPDGCVVMYDDIKIVARPLQTCKHEVDGWREHFGPLAEIWS